MTATLHLNQVPFHFFLIAILSLWHPAAHAQQVPPPSSVQDTLSGYVLTPDGQPVPRALVHVALSAAHPAPHPDSCRLAFPLAIPTDPQSGRYHLVVPRGCRHLSLYATSSDTLPKRHSVREVLRLLKHIMGIRPLPSSSALLVADINSSHNVNTYDALLVKNSILGVPDTLHRHTRHSWILRSSAASADADGFAVYSDRQQHLDYETGHDYAPGELDFLGLKMGDFAEPIRPQQQPLSAIYLSWPLAAIQAGEVFTLPICVQGEKPIEALQAELHFDPAKMLLLGPSRGQVEGFFLRNFNLSAAATGQIKLLWHTTLQDEEERGQPGDCLFHLTFKALRPLPVTDSLLRIDSTEMPPVVCLSDTVLGKLGTQPLQSKAWQAAQPPAPSSPGLQASCSPHPDSGLPTCHVLSARSSKARVWLRNAEGRRLLHRDVLLSAGVPQDVVLTEVAQLPAGIYLWKVTQSGERAEGHWIKE
ncbi:MAG TPA: hypothetical protein PKD78_04035 [Saprospiraceae bacterium]|nr:hypothetical protein [Saprospiraceae bacterium]